MKPQLLENENLFSSSCRSKAVMSGLSKVKMFVLGNIQGDIIDQGVFAL